MSDRGHGDHPQHLLEQRGRHARPGLQDEQRGHAAGRSVHRSRSRSPTPSSVGGGPRTSSGAGSGTTLPVCVVESRVPPQVRHEIEVHLRAGRLTDTDFTPSNVSALEVLPVGIALQAVAEFARMDRGRVQHPPAYLLGIMRRLSALPPSSSPPWSPHHRPPPPDPAWDAWSPQPDHRGLGPPPRMPYVLPSPRYPPPGHWELSPPTEPPRRPVYAHHDADLRPHEHPWQEAERWHRPPLPLCVREAPPWAPRPWESPPPHAHMRPPPVLSPDWDARDMRGVPHPLSSPGSAVRPGSPPDMGSARRGPLWAPLRGSSPPPAPHRAGRSPPRAPYFELGPSNEPRRPRPAPAPSSAAGASWAFGPASRAPIALLSASGSHPGRSAAGASAQAKGMQQVAPPSADTHADTPGKGGVEGRSGRPCSAARADAGAVSHALAEDTMGSSGEEEPHDGSDVQAETGSAEHGGRTGSSSGELNQVFAGVSGVPAVPVKVQ